MANEYKDKKGHYTTKENNDKECIHSSSRQAQVERYADISANELADKLKQEVDKKPFINIFLFGNNFEKMPKHLLVKSKQSLKKQIERHKQKIRYPKLEISNWDDFNERHKDHLIRHWKSEIKNFEQQIEKIDFEIKRR